MNLTDWLCILVISSKFFYVASDATGNFQCLSAGKFPNKGDKTCRTYIYCYFYNGSFRKQTYTCPGDRLLFNPNHQLCEPTYLCQQEPISVSNSPAVVTNSPTVVTKLPILVTNSPETTTKELKQTNTEPCEESRTRVTGRNLVCKNSIVLEDNFEGYFINTDKWTVEQYIPRDPDYEFVIYTKDTDVISANKGLFRIKPKLIQDVNELNKATLDLSDGCTRNDVRDCKNEIFIIQNPIISGRMVSKVSFLYGDIEIKAKLPSGDWIYPQIYLEGENNQKIVIAYARGNQRLIGNDNADIGGTLLFAGPELSSKEPQRSSKLSSFNGQSPFSNDFHVYRLKWSRDNMEFYLDGNKFGEVSGESIRNTGLDGKPLKLVLGVGVGGLNDFPDNFKPISGRKPWRNGNRLQVKKFYDSRNEWYNQTWGDDSQLQINYVRIRSL